jgi:hypothetical protein
MEGDGAAVLLRAGLTPAVSVSALSAAHGDRDSVCSRRIWLKGRYGNGIRRFTVLLRV